MRRLISGRLFRRLWLVFCDHSVVGVWRTKREAVDAVRVRARGSILEVDYHVAGPYVLRSTLRSEGRQVMYSDKDARAFNPNAGAIEALLDTELPMQLQHYERPRARRTACGKPGQVAATAYAVTCPKCREYVARRGGR